MLHGCPRTLTITDISTPQKSCLGLEAAEAQYHRLRKIKPLVHAATHVPIVCVFDNPCYCFDVYQHVLFQIEFKDYCELATFSQLVRRQDRQPPSSNTKTFYKHLI